MPPPLAGSGGVSCCGVASGSPLPLGPCSGALLGWARRLAQTHHPAVCLFFTPQILPGHWICHPLCPGSLSSALHPPSTVSVGTWLLPSFVPETRPNPTFISFHSLPSDNHCPSLVMACTMVRDLPPIAGGADATCDPGVSLPGEPRSVGREGMRGGIRGFLSGTSTALGPGHPIFSTNSLTLWAAFPRKPGKLSPLPIHFPGCLWRDPSQHPVGLVEPSTGATYLYPAQDSLPTELAFLVACGFLILTFLVGSSKR